MNMGMTFKMGKWMLQIVSIVLIAQFSWASCNDNFHFALKPVQHKIPFAGMSRLEKFAEAGNPAEGWREAAKWGDPYAAVAAKVLAKKAVFPASFYKKLIRTHWINVNGTLITNRNFLGTAQQHFRQYVEILHSGNWPDSDQIVMSYLKAVRDHNMPDVTVFDAAWDAGGFNMIRSWQALNHLPPERIVYPTKACFNIQTQDAFGLISEDFVEIPFKYIFEL